MIILRFRQGLEISRSDMQWMQKGKESDPECRAHRDRCIALAWFASLYHDLTAEFLIQSWNSDLSFSIYRWSGPWRLGVMVVSSCSKAASPVSSSCRSLMVS